MEPAIAKEMIRGAPDTLHSEFHLEYSMLLNLLRWVQQALCCESQNAMLHAPQPAQAGPDQSHLHLQMQCSMHAPLGLGSWSLAFCCEIAIAAIAGPSTCPGGACGLPPGKTHLNTKTNDHFAAGCKAWSRSS